MNNKTKWLTAKGILLSNLLTLAILFPLYSSGITCGSLFESRIKLSTEKQVLAVSQIEPGAVLEFTDGARFIIGSVLSNAGTDGIFKLSDGQVLRVHKYGGETIDQYIDGYRALIDAGIPVPKIVKFRRGQWILVEGIDVQLRLKDIFIEPTKLLPGEREKLKNEFMKFVAKFRDFNFISDFYADQIVYAKNRGWMLLDWRDMHVHGNQVNPFIPVWEGIPYSVEKNNESLNHKVLEDWKLGSDKTIAEARGHSPDRYYNMTPEEITRLIYAN